MDKVAIAGGVASNKHLREAMEKACKENGFPFLPPVSYFLYRQWSNDRGGAIMNL